MERAVGEGVEGVEVGEEIAVEVGLRKIESAIDGGEVGSVGVVVGVVVVGDLGKMV